MNKYFEVEILLHSIRNLKIISYIIASLEKNIKNVHQL